MRLVCPSCGGVYSAEAWLNDPIARQCLRLVCELPHAVSSRCFAYLSLFRPPGRSLQWKKVLRLLAELRELATLPYIQWGKKVARPNSAHAWGLAMERMIEHPPKRLPLKSHGYLRSVAYEIADEMDRKKETARNKDEREGKIRRLEGKKVNPQQPQRISAEIMRDIRKQNMGQR